MSWPSIAHAHAYWQHLLQSRSGRASNLERAERFILTESPATSAEAACILEVIGAYKGDARCDGLDQAALQRVLRFLSSDPARQDKRARK